MRVTLLLALMFLSSQVGAAVYFEVEWTSDYKKQLMVSCDNGSTFCQELCGEEKLCIKKEGACRDCIGTSLMMTNIITELGRTIVNSGNLSQETTFLDLVRQGEFVTLAPNDVYNVIDATGSIRAMKKFEALCPEGSLDQLLFLKVDRLTRKINAPVAVYCMMDEGSLIYDISSRPDVIINLQGLGFLY